MGRTILLVEDEAALGKMLPRVMWKWGYKALYAANANEALALAHVHRADIALVICNAVLPDMPGPSLARMIRGMCPRVKTCFMSGYPFENLRERDLPTEETLQDPSVS